MLSPGEDAPLLVLVRVLGNAEDALLGLWSENIFKTPGRPQDIHDPLPVIFQVDCGFPRNTAKVDAR
jgi:hypothetical protein